MTHISARDASPAGAAALGGRQEPASAPVGTLCFMHIPKTSGTSVTAGLKAALRPVLTVTDFDLCLFGDFREFDSFIPALQRTIHHTPQSLPQAAGLVAGHIALSTLRQAYPSAPVLTVLREPFSRLLSLWLFWRQSSDASLAPWGAWAERVRCARQPLRAFLDAPQVACQTDNMVVRMLLWPHPAVPDDGFIDPAQDDRLVAEAAARLDGLDFTDVVENEALAANLGRRIGCDVPRGRDNETGAVPAALRAPLSGELTEEAHALLTARSRLDLQLWARLAGRRLAGHDIPALRQRTLMANMARYGALMACGN